MNQVQLLGGILYWRLNPRNNSNFITLTTTTEKIQSVVTAAIFLKFGRHSCSCYFIHRLIFVIEDVTETAAWPSLRVRNWSKKKPQMTTSTTDQGLSMNGILFLWNSLILSSKASNTTQRFKLWCHKYPCSVMSAGVPLAGWDKRKRTYTLGWLDDPTTIVFNLWYLGLICF